MKKVQLFYSDGKPFDLEVGQLWCTPDDFTLEIIDILFSKVEVKQIESGETYFHEIDGSNGFADFLESNCYILKK